MNLLWMFLLAGCVSWLLTGLLRRYALAKSLMDEPNERSSHSVATPRGGGVSIVITFLAGLVILWVMHILNDDAVIGMAGAGIVISVIGFIDDHNHISARWRLLGHFSAAAWIVFWFGGMPLLDLFGYPVDMGWAGYVLAITALVWFLNLYNFMDGIDGIAGVEALSSTLVAGLIFLFVYDNQTMVSLNALLFMAVAGFLTWNFPPAKIFMGDAGSGFLGLMLGALVLLSANIDSVMLWVWLILLGSFTVDATYTLIRRLLRGDKVYEAHRSHAYQYASRKFGSHLTVTLSVLAINLFWLAPWSVFVVLGEINGILGLIVAYLPLLYLEWHFHAGEIEQRS